MRSLFDWYLGLLRHEDVGVIIATIAATFGGLTFAINFIIKPVYRFLMQKLKNLIRGLDQKRKSKHAVYTNISAVIQSVFSAVDELILSYHPLDFKNAKTRNEQLRTRVEHLKAKISLSSDRISEITTELKKEYDKINSKAEETVQQLKNLLQLKNFDVSDEILISHHTSKQIFEDFKESKEEELRQLEAEVNTCQEEIDNVQEELDRALSSFTDKVEAELIRFNDKIDAAILQLNNMPEVGIIASEQVIDAVTNLRDKMLLLKLYLLDKLRLVTIEDISSLIKSTEWNNLKNQCKRLQLLMRKELV
jgi:ElaB/YqjD/DUF883 family membrane-anchored ribosome-binding protein